MLGPDDTYRKTSSRNLALAIVMPPVPQHHSTTTSAHKSVSVTAGVTPLQLGSTRHASAPPQLLLPNKLFSFPPASLRSKCGSKATSHNETRHDVIRQLQVATVLRKVQEIEDYRQWPADTRYVMQEGCICLPALSPAPGCIIHGDNGEPNSNSRGKLTEQCLAGTAPVIGANINALRPAPNTVNVKSAGPLICNPASQPHKPDLTIHIPPPGPRACPPPAVVSVPTGRPGPPSIPASNKHTDLPRTVPQVMPLKPKKANIPAPAQNLPPPALSAATPSAASSKEHTAPVLRIQQAPHPPTVPHTAPPAPQVASLPLQSALAPPAEPVNVNPPRHVGEPAHTHEDQVVTSVKLPVQDNAPGSPQGGTILHPARATPLTDARDPNVPPPLPLSDLVAQYHVLITQRVALRTRREALRTRLAQLAQLKEERRRLLDTIVSLEGDVEKEEVEVEVMEAAVRRREVEGAFGRGWDLEEIRKVKSVLGLELQEGV
ncbi:hypothetical protein DXG01_016255 [Tephrocybe rancida]|nr:hypothetical protein DXG01_016255 [Tephrocybe rancida]